jgi:hypothetical protein
MIVHRTQLQYVHTNEYIQIRDHTRVVTVARRLRQVNVCGTMRTGVKCAVYSAATPRRLDHALPRSDTSITRRRVVTSARQRPPPPPQHTKRHQYLIFRYFYYLYVLLKLFFNDSIILQSSVLSKNLNLHM